MTYDVVVIGAGAAGEASASLGAELGGKTAVIERDLFGGQCSFWACLPAKCLLDSARRRALGADYPWARASDRRDWMISREEIDYPDDSNHVRRLEESGAELVRGEARIAGPGRVEVRSNGGPPRSLETRNLILATGSVPIVPPIEGLEETGYWTNPEATSLRELPSSVVILGGGPMGAELAQVFARFQVKTIVVEGADRLLPRDHPESSKVVADQLSEDGVEIRAGVMATKVSADGAGRRVTLSDGSVVEGAELVVAVGRRADDLRTLGAEEAGVHLGERGTADPDEHMRIGDGVFVAGDAAGGLQFTHLADYEGRVAVRTALGHEARADLSAVPRATYTEPETGAVGLTVEEAHEQGIDAFEVTEDFATSARGYTIEGSRGHVTVVADRKRGTLVGAFAACPAASELIHLAVLGLKEQIPLRVLADTMTAYPTGARVLGWAIARAADQIS